MRNSDHFEVLPALQLIELCSRHMRGLYPAPLLRVVHAVADEHVLSELLERRHHHRAV